MSNIIAILQARMGSTRLPGKVLKNLLEAPMLVRQIERIRASREITRVIVATSEADEDDAVFQCCEDNNIACFRGELDDVLARFYFAAALHDADHVVRLTGDCPLIDPAIIDQVIQLHINGGNDYTSNIHPATFPDGLDVEVFTWECLQKAYDAAHAKHEREHVTPYMYRHDTRNKIGNLSYANDLSAYRWTVDEAVDFELIQEIFKALYQPGLIFHMNDVLTLFKSNPDLQKINQGIKRNEGYVIERCH